MWVYNNANPKSPGWVSVNMTGSLQPTKLEFDKNGAVTKRGPPRITSDNNALIFNLDVAPELTKAWQGKSTTTSTAAGAPSGISSVLRMRVTFKDDDGASAAAGAIFLRGLDASRVRLRASPTTLLGASPEAPRSRGGAERTQYRVQLVPSSGRNAQGRALGHRAALAARARASLPRQKAPLLSDGKPFIARKDSFVAAPAGNGNGETGATSNSDASGAQ